MPIATYAGRRLAAMKSESLRLFQTLPHACGYFADRIAQNLVIDPSAPQLPQVYDIALTHGYRRAGAHVYQPHCQGCNACIAARVPAAEFVPDRSQKRCQRRNADLVFNVVPPSFSSEYFELYSRYLDSRHRDGGMDNPARDDFDRFLYTSWSPTKFLELREGNRLLAVAVTDIGAHGISAVYTFYEPECEARGLGTYAILRQIALAQEMGLKYVYLGYWISGHAKMDYKSRFRPLEILREGRWQRLGV